MKNRSKPRRFGSSHRAPILETDFANSRTFSTISAQARPRRKASSLEMIFRTPSSEIESLRRRIMFLSERNCQRWMSLDMSPATSNAKTPTLDFFAAGFG
ncbi:hypothetical protein PanWU01x14_084700 [Parasponia andersonii]|uniref:Uncharacterized protein n=1 Tax=Parasponia andersonii TaxID=3476 RepID=A0A2P5D9P9_PARAD|nr:hypothetical protein PanWU01x14_084700 [Parasponia andersonii]